MMVDVTRLSSEEWEAWQAEAVAAERQRQTRLAEARSRREAHAPCSDPFCLWCVPFGRHLDLDIQQRRREAWAAQDRERAAARIQQLRETEIREVDGFLHDLTLLRKAAGLTQSTLAAKAGITRESLSRIEAGTVRPRRRVVDRLRAALAPVRTGSGLPREAQQDGSLDARSRPSPSGGNLEAVLPRNVTFGRAQRQRQRGAGGAPGGWPGHETGEGQPGRHTKLALPRATGGPADKRRA